MRLRRIVVWSVLAIVLAALVLAMVIVWTANEREWYIDSAGITATLDMTLTDTGRWLAMAILAVMTALVIVAFVVEFATANTSKSLRRSGPLIPSLEERSPIRSIHDTAHDAAPPASAGAEPQDHRSGPASYASTIVGDRDTRRVERSVPPQH
ncbi:MAG: hypothetical protein AB7R89_21315 [Dehalococcoidia bacterium]